ncbi:MAG: RHS repeat-associated core domain-containing protein [Polyangiaceae bacterium]
MGAGKYEYDAFGRRIKKTKYDPQRTAPVTTLYTCDGEVLAAEIDTEQGPRTFVHEPGTFEPVLQQQNGEVFLCVNDHWGMPKDLVAGDGAVAWSATHSAYGRVVATYADETARSRYGTAINSPFRLLGQVADDDAELCFSRYRWFDPEIGSWISSDPLEIEGGLNLYGFDGAPTDVVDPLGLAGNKHEKDEDKSDQIHEGKQGKHVPGHNNFQPGKSELTHPNPQALLDKGKGTGIKHGPDKGVVDFGEGNRRACGSGRNANTNKPRDNP